MNDKILNDIKTSISTWENDKLSVYQKKRFYIAKGIGLEYMYRFSINLNIFFCNDKLIPIELISNVFHTTTLDSSTYSTTDKINLDKFLLDFDSEFEKLVDQKIKDCKTLFVSDPSYWNL